MDRDDDAKDRTQGIDGINAPDARLTRAIAQHRHGDQGQGHTGEKRGREHHQHRDGTACQHEQRVAVVRPRQVPHQPAHPVEALCEQRERHQRSKAHPQLRPASRRHGIANLARAPAYPKATESQPEDESRKHQLE